MKEIFLALIDSTNAYAKQHAATFEPNEITCIFADEQTAGRGRFNRPWNSPKGVNIYATFCFGLPSTQLHLTALSQVMSASLTSVLLTEGLSPTIKWPNDIRLEGKKLCGVLTEVIFAGALARVFIGVGLNVNMEQGDFASIDQAATSLKVITNRVWDKNALLKKIQLQFERDLEKFKAEGFKPFHSFYEQFLYSPGEPIQLFDGKKNWIGTFHSLHSDGGLNILLPDNIIHTIYSNSS